MDIRGIEVTNQLRSAIRAKLLELGVRYDEELPDYILVMVVNKKTRQQMHEDLRLFLEDSTTPFVEWLHDQVLKKLQKVTVAKKKTSREFVPAVVVKQEEERKKRKNASINAEESSNAHNTEKKIPEISTKEEKLLEKTTESSSSIISEEENRESLKNHEDSNVPDETAAINCKEAEVAREKVIPEKITSSVKVIETASKSCKRTLENWSREAMENVEKRQKSTDSSERNKPEECLSEDKEASEEEIAKEKEGKERGSDEEENEGGKEKRLKSCVNKPRVTSVVSVKTRLGTISPRKKFEINRNRFGDSSRQNLRTVRNNDFSHPRGNFSRLENDREDYSRSRDNAISRARRTFKVADSHNRQLFERSEDKRGGKVIDNEKRSRSADKATLNVKDRLGTNKNVVSLKKIDNQEETIGTKRSAIKNRLGPMRNREILKNHTNDYATNKKEKGVEKEAEEIEDEDEEQEEENDDDASIFNSGPVKSRIIAVNRPDITDKRGMKDSDKNIQESSNPEDGEDMGKTIASKVIVTPRPLKPLQPVQKRATQSLLLRAVAEANRSVVKQKNPEPVLKDIEPRLKRQRPSGNRDLGENLSVHLNATKRFVMEKIQVQLSTEDEEENSKTKNNNPHPVNEDHMGVVMSLFQRSDDSQKFLVTLNGYNNNVVKEKKLFEKEDEHFQVEALEEDEETLMSSLANDSSDQFVSSPRSSPLNDIEEENRDNGMETENIIITDENNENENIENVEIIDQLPERKRRKLSPIVYTRSRSRSPVTIARVAPISLVGKEVFEKGPVTNVSGSSTSDKSREKCRYWPNCTLGTKCAYHHPGVPCSAFPACKYGEKCVYKHPKCKFGSACTKIGCAFSHPQKLCKYHPFCTKPTCSYSHPTNIVPGDGTRTKFTWKRQD